MQRPQTKFHADVMSR